MGATKEEKEGAKEEKKLEIITAVYKVNLHCRQCASDIKKPLLKTQGVHGVEVLHEKGEIKVKGVIDVIKIHKRIEKLSKKKVEIVSPQIKIPSKEEAAAKLLKKEKETKEKEQIVRTTTVKVHLHCDKCAQDLRKKLIKHKGIYSVKTDMKAQTLTVQGTIAADKLVSYMRNRVHKHAELIKEVKVEAKKDEVEAKKDKVEAKKDEVIKAGGKSTEKTEIVEFKQEAKVEVKSKEGTTPYFVHYVYAPQLFSDENPNACFII